MNGEKSTIQDWIEFCGEESERMGWWDNRTFENRFGWAMLLIHSELSEATEEIRSGNNAKTYTVDINGKLIGFQPEMADVLIRVFDLLHHSGIDSTQFVNLMMEKLLHNRTRGVRHGGKIE